jgi:hypothetical protein
MHSAWLLPLAIPLIAYGGRMGFVALKSVFDERITERKSPSLSRDHSNGATAIK